MIQAWWQVSSKKKHLKYGSSFVTGQWAFKKVFTKSQNAWNTTQDFRLEEDANDGLENSELYFIGI